MSTDIDALVAFIEARLAELEAAANAATPGKWLALDGGVVSADDETQWPVADTQSARNRADRVHIALHDPARVLDEVAGIRLILAEHAHVRATRSVEGIDFGCRICAYGSAYDEVAPLGWCRTVRGVAAIWKRHPEYDEGWKP